MSTQKKEKPQDANLPIDLDTIDFGAVIAGLTPYGRKMMGLPYSQSDLNKQMRKPRKPREKKLVSTQQNLID